MASRDIEAVLKLKDELSSKINTANNNLNSLNRTVTNQQKKLDQIGKNTGFKNLALSIGAASVALAAGRKALDFMSGSLKAYSSQVDSVNQLNLALANQGNLLPGTSQRLQEYASSLQRITTYGDEVILKNQALLASFGMNEDQLKTTTKVALDFATATGRDMTVAVNLLGKAFVGETGELSRYGVIIDKSIPKSEKFNEVIRQLTERFGGQAQAATETFTGKTQQLSNAFGDLKEQAGKLFSFMASGGGAMSGLSDAMEWASVGIDKVIVALGEIDAMFMESQAAASEFIAKLLDNFAMLPWVGDNINSMSEHLRQNAVDLRAAAEASRELSNQSASSNVQTMEVINQTKDLSTVITTALVPAFDIARSRMKMVEDDMAELNDFMGSEFVPVAQGVGDLFSANNQMMADSFRSFGIMTRAESQETLQKLEDDFRRIKESGLASNKAIAEAEKKLAEMRQELSEEQVAVTLNTDAALLGSATQVLGELGSKYKAAAIAGAIINTFQAIAKANATYPWPISIPMMAAAGAVGALQVAKIRGAQAGFAKGTANFDFQNFGRETPTVLHGREAVIPQGGGHALAREIASAMAAGGGSTRAGMSNVTINLGGVNVSGSTNASAQQIGEAVGLALRDNIGHALTRAKEGLSRIS